MVDFAEEGVSNVAYGYAFGWDVVAFFYKSAYYYKNVLIGLAMSFVRQ